MCTQTILYRGQCHHYESLSDFHYCGSDTGCSRTTLKVKSMEGFCADCLAKIRQERAEFGVPNKDLAADEPTGGSSTAIEFQVPEDRTVRDPLWFEIHRSPHEDCDKRESKEKSFKEEYDPDNTKAQNLEIWGINDKKTTNDDHPASVEAKTFGSHEYDPAVPYVDQCHLYFGNLAEAVGIKDLLAFLHGYHVRSIVYPVSRYAGRHCESVTVEFDNLYATQRARRELSGRELRGQKVVVSAPSRLA